jgi:hypothetical protein
MIAIGGAIGLVILNKVFDLEFYTNKILPLIPILYAIVYEVLEHRKENRTKARAKILPSSVERGDKADSWSAPALSFGRVITDVGVSFAVKFLIEMFLLALFLRFSGQSFSDAYGPFSIETVGRFLRGDHPWLSGNDGILMLALISIITCFITGLWIGYTSQGRAILEGVLAGAAITVVMSMTNMLILYRRIESVTEKLAGSLGYAMQAGFLVVIAVQVLLYGLWSGVVQMGKRDRVRVAVERRKKKRTKK